MIRLEGNFSVKSEIASSDGLAGAVRNFDRERMIDRLAGFPGQAGEALGFAESPALRLPARPGSIILSGLGGSAIAGDLLRESFADRLPVPFLINRDYALPACVNGNTLTFLVSYSGNTEETLAAYRQARERRVSMLALTSGGRLAEMAVADGVPLIRIPAGYPPRTAAGYLYWSLAGLLRRVGLLQLSEAEIAAVDEGVRTAARRCGPETPFSENPARRLAAVLRGALPVIYSGQYLSGVATRWKTQIEENGKALAFTGLMPEMNHNEVVGWSNPDRLIRELAVICLREPTDHPQVQRRFEIIPDLLQPRRFLVEVRADSDDRLARLFMLLVLGDWVSYYLALEYGIDPTPVERITALKRQLSKE
ncbi:MAG TPA: bifunctional phosphoglucose/phosphomannose isomerase [bacterium]|nr:bifunctional phosphoglucose/phosphomannose isomerase [bacterium]